MKPVKHTNRAKPLSKGERLNWVLLKDVKPVKLSEGLRYSYKLHENGDESIVREPESSYNTCKPQEKKFLVP